MMRVIATALSLAVLAACSKAPQPTAASSNDDPALVKAGQFQIHQSELDYQAGRILSQNANANWDDDAEKALLDSLALTAAMASERERFAAVATFAVTASGLTVFGVGAAFWGLIAGLLVHGLDEMLNRDK